MVVDDDQLKDWALSSGAVDCIMDLPENYDEKVEEILRVLITYAKTVKFRSARIVDFKRGE